MLIDKFNFTELGRRASLIRSNEKYDLFDISLGETVLSLTVLHKDQSTMGHQHLGTQEILIILRGEGELETDKGRHRISMADICLVSGEYHKITNMGLSDLEFICIFQKYGERG